MALYLPVASRLSSRTGLPLSRLLLPIAAAIVMGGALTMVGNSPLILLNDLLVVGQRQPALGRGDARTAARCSRRCRSAWRCWRAALLYFRFFGDKLLQQDDDRQGRHAGAHAELFRPGLRHRRRRVRTDRHRRQPAGGHVARRSRSAARRAAAAGAEDRQRIAAGAAGRRAHLGRQRARRDGRRSSRSRDFAQNNFLRLSTRLRNFGDLFNPSRAGISEAVVPPTSQFIGKTAGRPAAAQAVRHQPAGGQPRQDRCIARTCASVPLRAGDMLVLHSIWHGPGAGRREQATSWWSPTTRRASSARTSSRSRSASSR